MSSDRDKRRVRRQRNFVAKNARLGNFPHKVRSKYDRKVKYKHKLLEEYE